MIQLTDKKTTILTTIILVIAGQLNINIIANGFTISMLIVFFLLFAFLLADFRPFLTTLLAAPLMIVIRGVMEWLNGADFLAAIIKYAPEVIFVLLYGALFSIFAKKISFKEFRILKFVPLIGIDFFANMVEIVIRLGRSGLTTSVLSKLFIIAIGRTIIAAILIALFAYYGEFMIRKDEQQRYKKLLLLIADLKSEMVWMNKNTSDIEHITANAYEVYQYVKESGNQEYKTKSLELAKDIHEIKKEYFLIMRGINEALEEESISDSMKMSYLLQILQESLQAHHRTDESLLNIRVNNSCELVTNKPYFILSILRNLVVNAVEAGQEQEETSIVVNCYETNGIVNLEVEDNCGGIDEDDKEEIFKPGFSTKIDYENGSTGRGLGLCIVKDLVETKLRGTIKVEGIQSGTKFVIEVPRGEIV